MKVYVPYIVIVLFLILNWISGCLQGRIPAGNLAEVSSAGEHHLEIELSSVSLLGSIGSEWAL